MGRVNIMTLAVLDLGLFTLYGCQELASRNPRSLFVPRLYWSEIVGFVAGLGTTFAAVSWSLAHPNWAVGSKIPFARVFN